ncbi:hypothetical protein HPB48_018816 [Haemaphysalis longicornis]|uniref:Transcription initiation factor IIA gamma subunit C-terminal domain-containing protein n=1 Tax=Haemaphysalis longicornis TaxID=44386 RepID=A0A9J6FZI6_HAELO|nr:hypothetical protein HPB48_018816 [Haemaphysalis longicornis]
MPGECINGTCHVDLYSDSCSTPYNSGDKNDEILNGEDDNSGNDCFYLFIQGKASEAITGQSPVRSDQQQQSNSTCALFLVRGRGNPAAGHEIGHACCRPRRGSCQEWRATSFSRQAGFSPHDPESRFVSSAHEEKDASPRRHTLCRNRAGQCGQITPHLALKVLLQFDKSINNALANRVKTRLTFKVNCSFKPAHLSTYRFCDNVWTFVLKDVEFREVQELVKATK